MEQKSKKEMLINSNYFEIKQLHRQATLHPRSFVLIAYKRNFGPLHLMQKTAGAGAKCPRSRFVLSENVREIFSMCLRTFRRLLRQSFRRSFCTLFYANFTAVFSAISIISVKLS